MLAYNGSIPGPRSVSGRDPRSPSMSETTATSRPPSTGTGCASTTGTTACPTRPRRRSRSGATSPTRLSSPTRGSTGTTRTSARTTGWTWASTAPSRRPADPDYWAPVDREFIVTLDDVLVEDGQDRAVPRAPAHLRGHGPLRQRHAHRRRDRLSARGQAGEVVRFYLINTANTRIFNVASAGRPHEAGRRRQRPLRARALRRRGAARPVRARRPRRAVRHARDLPVEHHTPDHTYVLGTIAVPAATRASPRPPVRDAPHDRRADRRAVSDIDRHPTSARQDPGVRVADAAPLRRHRSQTATAWTCPMHPEVVRRGAGDVSDLRDEAGADPSGRRPQIPARRAQRNAWHSARRTATASSGRTSCPRSTGPRTRRT